MSGKIFLIFFFEVCAWAGVILPSFARDNFFWLRREKRERRAFDVIRQLDASPPSLECM